MCIRQEGCLAGVIMATEIVFAAYKPNDGKEEDLLSLIKKHAPVLKECKLITDRPSLTIKSKDGTYIEVIEWRNVEASKMAHEHPPVAEIWEQMAAISSFVPLNQLAETKEAFSHYQVVKI